MTRVEKEEAKGGRKKKSKQRTKKKGKNRGKRRRRGGFGEQEAERGQDESSRDSHSPKKRRGKG